MRYTPQQQKNLKRIFGIIERIQNGDNFMNYSPYHIAGIRKCYKDLTEFSTAKTISHTVVSLYTECGFTAHKVGSEWIIKA